MSANSRQVYLPADAASLESMKPGLEKRFSDAKFSGSGTELAARFGNWTARIVDFRESWVVEEAKEMVERAPENARLGLAAATHRIEIYESGDAEADDHHYNEGLLLFEHFLDTPGAIGFDPVSGDFSVGSSRLDDDPLAP